MEGKIPDFILDLVWKNLVKTVQFKAPVTKGLAGVSKNCRYLTMKCREIYAKLRLVNLTPL